MKTKQTTKPTRRGPGRPPVDEKLEIAVYPRLSVEDHRRLSEIAEAAGLPVVKTARLMIEDAIASGWSHLASLQRRAKAARARS